MKGAPWEAGRIPVQIRLSALWTAMMILYAYADILSFYRPGAIAQIEDGKMGPLDATQGSLLFAGVLMAIPALMIVLTLALAPAVARGLNLVLGALYTLVNVGNLVGETWAYYLVLGGVEIALTLAILGYAWKWPRSTT